MDGWKTSTLGKDATTYNNASRTATYTTTMKEGGFVVGAKFIAVVKETVPTTSSDNKPVEVKAETGGEVVLTTSSEETEQTTAASISLPESASDVTVTLSNFKASTTETAEDKKPSITLAGENTTLNIDSSSEVKNYKIEVPETASGTVINIDSSKVENLTLDIKADNVEINVTGEASLDSIKVSGKSFTLNGKKVESQKEEAGPAVQSLSRSRLFNNNVSVKNVDSSDSNYSSYNVKVNGDVTIEGEDIEEVNISNVAIKGRLYLGKEDKPIKKLTIDNISYKASGVRNGNNYLTPYVKDLTITNSYFDIDNNESENTKKVYNFIELPYSSTFAPDSVTISNNTFDSTNHVHNVINMYSFKDNVTLDLSNNTFKNMDYKTTQAYRFSNINGAKNVTLNLASNSFNGTTGGVDFWDTPILIQEDSNDKSFETFTFNISSWSVYLGNSSQELGTEWLKFADNKNSKHKYIKNVIGVWGNSGVTPSFPKVSVNGSLISDTNEVVEVSNAAALKNALVDNAVIKLTSDISLTQNDPTSIAIRDNLMKAKNVSIDLNNHKLSSSWYTLQISTKVNFSNGTIENTISTTAIFINGEGDLTLNNVNVTSLHTAICLGRTDTTSNVKNMKLNMTGGSLKAKVFGLTTNASGQKADTDYSGSSVNLTNVEIDSTYQNTDKDNTGIYVNLPINYSISGGSIKADRQAVIVRNGDVTIDSTKIEYTGAWTDNNKNQNKDENWGSGNEVAKAAFVVGDLSSTAYFGNASLTLTNCNYTNSSSESSADIYVTDDGTYNSTINVDNTNTGTFAYIMKGIKASDKSKINDRYVAIPKSVSNETELRAALQLDNAVIKLTQDITLNGSRLVASANDMKFDLNGHKITGSSTDRVMDVTGYLTIDDSSNGSGSIESSYKATMIVAAKQNGGSGQLNIKNGTFKSSTFNCIGSGTFTNENNKTSGIVNITGGTFEAQETCLLAVGGSVINTYGGTFTSKDNFVVGSNGIKGAGGNSINITGGTFNANISTSGYIACGIYVANNDTVSVNRGTFNINGGIGILARSGTTKVTSTLVTFNITTKDGLTQGYVGDNKTNIPVGYEVVIHKNANYPGGEPKVTYKGSKSHTI